MLMDVSVRSCRASAVAKRRSLETAGWSNSRINVCHSASLRTASVNQVRQPIYRTSKGRWQAYADRLSPLLSALGVDAS